MAAIVGRAGLPATRRGARRQAVLLANKEALVMAGRCSGTLAQRRTTVADRQRAQRYFCSRLARVRRDLSVRGCAAHSAHRFGWAVSAYTTGRLPWGRRRHVPIPTGHGTQISWIRPMMNKGLEVIEVSRSTRGQRKSKW
jgi:hypothetical protein